MSQLNMHPPAINVTVSSHTTLHQTQTHYPPSGVKTQRNRATCYAMRYRTVRMCVIVRTEGFIGVAVHRKTGRARLSLDLLQQTFIITSTEHWIFGTFDSTFKLTLPT
jgi:hypothetical protein